MKQEIWSLMTKKTLQHYKHAVMQKKIQHREGMNSELFDFMSVCQTKQQYINMDSSKKNSREKVIQEAGRITCL